MGRGKAPTLDREKIKLVSDAVTKNNQKWLSYDSDEDKQGSCMDIPNVHTMGAATSTYRSEIHLSRAVYKLTQ